MRVATSPPSVPSSRYHKLSSDFISAASFQDATQYCSGPSGSPCWAPSRNLECSCRSTSELARSNTSRQKCSSVISCAAVLRISWRHNVLNAFVKSSLSNTWPGRRSRRKHWAACAAASVSFLTPKPSWVGAISYSFPGNLACTRLSTHTGTQLLSLTHSKYQTCSPIGRNSIFGRLNLALYLSKFSQIGTDAEHLCQMSWKTDLYFSRSRNVRTIRTNTQMVVLSTY